jgi:hypothetical protein
LDNIKLYLREVRGWGCMDYTYQPYDRDKWKARVNIVMNLQVQQNVGKFLSSCTPGNFKKKKT